jgi:hypothetical protein
LLIQINPGVFDPRRTIFRTISKPKDIYDADLYLSEVFSSQRDTLNIQKDLIGIKFCHQTSQESSTKALGKFLKLK